MLVDFKVITIPHLYWKMLAAALVKQIFNSEILIITENTHKINDLLEVWFNQKIIMNGKLIVNNVSYSQKGLESHLKVTLLITWSSDPALKKKEYIINYIPTLSNNILILTVIVSVKHTTRR